MVIRYQGVNLVFLRVKTMKWIWMGWVILADSRTKRTNKERASRPFFIFVAQKLASYVKSP